MNKYKEALNIIKDFAVISHNDKKKELNESINSLQELIDKYEELYDAFDIAVNELSDNYYPNKIIRDNDIEELKADLINRTKFRNLQRYEIEVENE